MYEVIFSVFTALHDRETDVDGDVEAAVQRERVRKHGAARRQCRTTTCLPDLLIHILSACYYS